jgi:hypothetical protein
MDFEAIEVRAPARSFLTDQEHELLDALVDAGLPESDARFALALTIDLEDA